MVRFMVDVAMLCGASAGWQSLISGSNLNNGVNAGPANLNANNSESGNRNANISRQEAALKFIDCQHNINLASWQNRLLWLMRISKESERSQL